MLFTSKTYDNHTQGMQSHDCHGNEEHSEYEPDIFHICIFTFLFITAVLFMEFAIYFLYARYSKKNKQGNANTNNKDVAYTAIRTRPSEVCFADVHPYSI